MRIIAGAWRGRSLVAPPGATTRPTAQRMRQALFDMLMHAPWAENQIPGATVLDAFAGTGALGLEALSRGAATCHFIENNKTALQALRQNIEACQANAKIVPADALHPPAGTPCTLIFLDPPYSQNLVAPALAALTRKNWIAPNALIIVESAHTDPLPPDAIATRTHGMARISVWRSK